MDAKRNRNKMFADTNESGYVWTGPKTGNMYQANILLRDPPTVIFYQLYPPVNPTNMFKVRCAKTVISYFLPMLCGSLY